MTDATVVRDPDPSLITTLHVTYALHALGLAIGAFGTATVVGAFLFGWPSIIAVIINYVKRGDASGTWLESHFSWQIRTFWYAVLWAIVLAAINFVLIFLVVGLLTWPMSFFVLGIWAIYRIALGWSRLGSRRPVG